MVTSVSQAKVNIFKINCGKQNSYSTNNSQVFWYLHQICFQIKIIGMNIKNNDKKWEGKFRKLGYLFRSYNFGRCDQLLYEMEKLLKRTKENFSRIRSCRQINSSVSYQKLHINMYQKKIKKLENFVQISQITLLKILEQKKLLIILITI